jgi:Tfp pilus assembly PilM family ATPase
VAFGLDKLASLTNLTGFAGGPPVAIDFGTQSLKVLQLTHSEPQQLIAAAALQTPQELLTDHAKRIEFQCEQLPGLIKSAGMKAKRAVCAIPSSQLFCKHVQVAPVPGQTVAQAATEAIAQQLGCDPFMLTCRVIEVQGASLQGKIEAIAMATASPLVARLMQAMRSAKLEPVGMQSEHQAMINAFRSVNRRTADKDLATLYLDIGAGITKVCVGHGTQLVFAKSISIGGRTLDVAVAQQAKCSLAEARTLRLSLNAITRQQLEAAKPVEAETAASGGMAMLAAAMARDGAAEAGASTATAVASPATISPAAAAAALAAQVPSTSSINPVGRNIDLTEPLRALTDEISLCVRYVESLFPDKRIARLIFVGGESRHMPICQHVARALRIPAHGADPLAKVSRTGSEPTPGIDLNSPQPGWCVPVGLLLGPLDL